MWSAYYSYPDLTFDDPWTGGIFLDVQPLSVTDTDFDVACDSSFTTGPGAAPWDSSHIQLLQDVGGHPYQVGQLFVHLDMFAFVNQRRSDGPDYPYPYPDSAIDGWEREGEDGLFLPRSGPLADIAAEFNRFRFSFDVIDAADVTGLDPVDVDVWVRPWTPAELVYGNLGVFPVGSYPGGRFASSDELNDTGNYAASGGHLAAGSTSTRVTTADLLPADFLDVVSHHDLGSPVQDAQFLSFTIAFAAQATHTPPGGSMKGRSIRVDNVSLDAQWARDRFRFQLGRPPLAYRQRRDGVASAGPTLAHLQGGGTGALRPDLAHRQQTP